MKHLVLAEGSGETCGAAELLVVEGQDFHYLTRVRRLEPGDRILALQGAAHLSLELETVTVNQACFRVLARVPVGRPGCQLTLFPFLLKGGKLDDVIRQACEAGVSRVVPIQGDHCVSRLEGAADETKKLLRWKQIARQAAQQSGNTAVCEVLPPLPSTALATHWDNAGPLLMFHQVVVPGPLAKVGLHRYLADTPGQVGLVIGPEGGLSPAEVTDFLAAGALPVWLGPAVLRAETASLHAVAAVNIILQERSQWFINDPPASPA